MIVRPWVGFVADFPDDQVEDGRDIVCFGGRNVAVAIGEILTGLGCQVSAPECAEEKGWEFDFYDEGRRRFWCQVTSFHPAFWLLFEDPAISRRTRAKNAAAYAQMWRELSSALMQDPRFRNLVWRSMEEGPPDPAEIAASRRGDRSHDEGPFAPEPEALSPWRALRSRLGRGLVGLVKLFLLAIGLGAIIVGLNDLRTGNFHDAGEPIFAGVFWLVVVGIWALQRS